MRTLVDLTLQKRSFDAKNNKDLGLINRLRNSMNSYHAWLDLIRGHLFRIYFLSSEKSTFMTFSKQIFIDVSGIKDPKQPITILIYETNVRKIMFSIPVINAEQCGIYEIHGVFKNDITSEQTTHLGTNPDIAYKDVQPILINDLSHNFDDEKFEEVR